VRTVSVLSITRSITLSIASSEESSNESLPADDSGGATHATGLTIT